MAPHDVPELRGAPPVILERMQLFREESAEPIVLRNENCSGSGAQSDSQGLLSGGNLAAQDVQTRRVNKHVFEAPEDVPQWRMVARS